MPQSRTSARNNHSVSASGNSKDMDSHMRELSDKHHRENIKILVALGFLGAYITIFANDVFEEYSSAINVFAGINLVYVIIKLNLTEFLSFTEISVLEKLNRLTRILYLFSINGFIILIAYQSISVNTKYSFNQGNIDPAVGVLVSTFSLVSVMIAYVSYKRRTTIIKSNVLIRNRMNDVLSQAVRDGHLGDEQKDLVINRCDYLLRKDGSDLGMLSLVVSTLLDGRSLELSFQSRSRIMGLLNKLEADLDRDEFDFNKLEEIMNIVYMAEEQ